MGCGRPPFGPAPGGGDGRRREEASPLLGAKLLRPGGALPARAEPSGCDMASSRAMKSKSHAKNVVSQNLKLAGTSTRPDNAVATPPSTDSSPPFYRVAGCAGSCQPRVTSCERYGRQR